MTRSNRGFTLIELCITAVIIGVLAAIILPATSCSAHGGATVASDGGGAPFALSEFTASVTGKERVSMGSGNDRTSKYLIYTDVETLENTDSLIDGKFNSSDVYGKLTVGKRYRFKVRGVRSGFLNSYRNVVAFTEER